MVGFRKAVSKVERRRQRALRVAPKDRKYATLFRRGLPNWVFKWHDLFGGYFYVTQHENLYMIRTSHKLMRPIWVARWYGKWIDATDDVKAVGIKFWGYGEYVFEDMQ